MGTKPRKPATPVEPSSTSSEPELPERWSVQRKSELVLRLLRGEAPTTRPRSCWPGTPTSCGAGTSRSCWGTLAERFIHETASRQGIVRDQLTIHADHRPAMTSKPGALLLADLGITKTHSRPHVSNDNPFSEAQFKTLKYLPTFPGRLGSIQEARAHCTTSTMPRCARTPHRGPGLPTCPRGPRRVACPRSLRSRHARERQGEGRCVGVRSPGGQRSKLGPL